MQFINYATALAITTLPLLEFPVQHTFFSLPSDSLFFSYKINEHLFDRFFCRCWTFYRQPNRSSEFILINHLNFRWHASCLVVFFRSWRMSVVWTFHNYVTNIIDFLSCINLKMPKNVLGTVKLLSVVK